MKTVFSKTRDVAALWAGQSQIAARTGSNTWMRGAFLFSYSTPIAAIVTLNGGQVALISSNQWSSGTSKVQGEAWDEAKARGLTIFRVPSLGYDGEIDHARNLGHMTTRAKEALDSIARCRPENIERYQQQAQRAIDEANKYAVLFGQSWRWHGRDPKSVTK